MNANFGYLVFAGFMAVSGCAKVHEIPAYHGEQNNLRAVLDAARHVEEKTVFKIPPRIHWEKMRKSVTVLTKAARGCDASALSATSKLLGSMGMELKRLRDGDVTYVVLRETKNVHRGAGVFALRCGVASDLVIQSPHGYFDLNTSGLGYKIFVETKARWLFQNTLHRYRGRENETPEDPDHPADVAHNPDLLFQAATKGALDARKSFLFVQFHGFDTAGRGTDIVLSDGRPRQQRMSERLEKIWKGHGWNVSVYGKHIRELGATTNIQGKAVARANGRFLHMEMDEEVRKALVGSKKKRRSLVESLIELSRDSGE